MDNYQIADAFSLLAKIMDIHGENSFKTKSYSVAAFQIEKLPRQLADMQADEIASHKGIGAAISKKIEELLQTGKLSLLEQYVANTPAGVIEMLNIKGLGPKKIHTVWKEMGIESIGELQYACHENRLTLYKGFGEKTQQNVGEAINFYVNQQGLFLYQQVESLALQLLATIRTAYPDQQSELAGAFGRQDEILDTITLVTTAGLNECRKLLELAGDTTLVDENEHALHFDLENGPKLIIHSSAANQFGNTMVRQTGTPEFLAALEPLLPAQSDFENEAAVFDSVGLPYLPAYLRNDANIIAFAKHHTLPDIIQPNQIKGIIHSHSTWSDGSNSIEEMAMAAKAQGLEYLVISDHSRSAGYANGLNEDRIRLQHVEIDKLNTQLAPFKIFKSIECDILNDGLLDYKNEVLASFDLVIASVHSNLKMSEEKAMHRLLTAIANPYVTILGHMTGRLLLSRNGYPIDHKQIIDACIANKVVIELNAHPRRLDIDWRWIQYVLERGGLISINPDAHAIDGFTDTRYGVLVAQKSMLTRERNLSSFSLDALLSYLQDTKAFKGLI